MKFLFVFFGMLLMPALAFAEKYQKAKIILKDGHELEGMATFLYNPAPIRILFKENENAKSCPIQCDEIKTLIYFTNNGKSFEFDRMPAYIRGSKEPRQVWLQAVKRGTVTLYTYDGVESLEAGAGSSITVFHTSWLCYRSNEETPTFITSTENKNKKGAFVQAALDYFKDDAELTEKIKSEQYKWDNMDKIVDEYNEWEKSHS